MISEINARWIAVGLVTSMTYVAWSEMQHGAPPGDIHLITQAPLASGSVGSTVVFGGAGYLSASHLSGNSYFDNSVIEAEYRAPSDDRQLRLAGVTHPSTRNDRPWRPTPW